MIGRLARLALWVLTFLGWAPFLVAATATAIASSRGCRLSEAGPSPCLIGGHDYGSLLYEMGMMWWVAIATSPLALLTLAAWIVMGIRRRLRR